MSFPPTTTDMKLSLLKVCVLSNSFHFLISSCTFSFLQLLSAFITLMFSLVSCLIVSYPKFRFHQYIQFGYSCSLILSYYTFLTFCVYENPHFLPHMIHYIFTTFLALFFFLPRFPKSKYQALISDLQGIDCVQFCILLFFQNVWYWNLVYFYRIFSCILFLYLYLEFAMNSKTKRANSIGSDVMTKLWNYSFIYLPVFMLPSISLCSVWFTNLPCRIRRDGLNINPQKCPSTQSTEYKLGVLLYVLGIGMKCGQFGLVLFISSNKQEYTKVEEVLVYTHFGLLGKLFMDLITSCQFLKCCKRDTAKILENVVETNKRLY
jgi:hypothetical protein